MKAALNSISASTMALLLSGLLAAGAPVSSIAESASAARRSAEKAPPRFDAVVWAEEAAQVLHDQMGKGIDKRIPARLIKQAKCVAVFPRMIQFALGLGGKAGSGLVSCRQPTTDEWGAPIYVRIAGANVGLQLGVKRAQTVILVMNDTGLDRLFSGLPVGEGEAGITVGPVGRGAQAGIDALMKNALISYTRSAGVFVGANLGGAVMGSRKDVNEELYGAYDMPRDILFGRRRVPESIRIFPQTLTHFAPIGL